MDVKLIRLSSLHVAAFCAKGTQPEIIALQTMSEWAQKAGLPFRRSRSRVFGFNNPDPKPGDPEYGYEAWLEVAEDVKGSGEIVIKDFPGGLFACVEVKGVENIFPGWQGLLDWQKNSGHKMGGEHICLEEHLSDLSAPEAEFSLRLYLPLEG